MGIALITIMIFCFHILTLGSRLIRFCRSNHPCIRGWDCDQSKSIGEQKTPYLLSSLKKTTRNDLPVLAKRMNKAYGLIFCSQAKISNSLLVLQCYVTAIFGSFQTKVNMLFKGSRIHVSLYSECTCTFFSYCNLIVYPQIVFVGHFYEPGKNVYFMIP